MIEFQTVPDPIFLAIFNEALEYVRDVQLVQYQEGYQPTRSEEQELDELYAGLYPELVPFFPRKQLIQVVERLLEACRAPELYRLTDYHWLVLYRCLEMFCDLHNDEALGRDVGKVGLYIVDKIDFDSIQNRFFFDTDFLFGSEFILAEEHRLNPVPDVSSQARKIAASVRPDLSDLELTMIDASASLAEPADERAMPKSGYVGPYPMREREEE